MGKGRWLKAASTKRKTPEGEADGNLPSLKRLRSGAKKAAVKTADAMAPKSTKRGKMTKVVAVQAENNVIPLETNNNATIASKISKVNNKVCKSGKGQPSAKRGSALKQ